MLTMIVGSDAVSNIYRDHYNMVASQRKRGRPRTLDKNIGLDIAARLFWQHGYEGTSIAHLTKAMGVAPPSLYAAFGSKEDLYRQALDYNAEHESKHRADAFLSEVPAYEAIAFYLHDAAYAFTDPAKPRGCMVSTAVLQHASENKAVAEGVTERRMSTIALMKTRFDRAVLENELRPNTDTDALAHFYVAIVQGMSAQACDGASREILIRMADVALSAWPKPQH
jgi:AcrR family transcriptional regulator